MFKDGKLKRRVANGDIEIEVSLIILYQSVKNLRERIHNFRLRIMSDKSSLAFSLPMN